MKPREAAEQLDTEAEGQAAEPKEKAPRRDAATPELFEEYGRTRDPALREKLILLHSNLVRYLARKFANRGEPLEDLTQVGMIGLMNAIDRFDASRGIRFATYATPTILGEIRRHFRDRGWAMKVPRRLQELSLATNKAVDSLTQELDRAPTVAEIAKRMEVSEQEVLEAMELGEMYELPSLDSELGDGSDDSRGALSDYVGGMDQEMERFESRARLSQALKVLPARERHIIELRFLRGMSQTDVARQMGISQMHVSRLQQRALGRLREAVREQDAA